MRWTEEVEGPSTLALPSAQTVTLRKRPTIHDVAREAGVSYGTVSRFLNGGKWVGEGSSAAVAEAIERVGYQINRFARSLKTGRSSTVAFLLTGPQDRLFIDPNIAVLLRETTAALTERGLALVLMTASTPAERQTTMTFIAGGHVDGVLLVSSYDTDPIAADLVAAGVPIVACGRPISSGFRLTSVGADDRAGAAAAVKHLINSGRTRIATITGPRIAPGSVDRLTGYLDALNAARLPVNDELIVAGSWTHESGRQAALELLDSGNFDAIFIASDTMASGALAALRTRNIRVPIDVSIVGFDDTGLAATLDPPLTTMRQPFAAISREMVRLLCEPHEDAIELHLPTELIVRASSE